MSCHPRYDDWKLASPEPGEEERDREEAERELAYRVTECQKLIDAECGNWPGEWTWTRANGKVEPQVSLTIYDHDRTRFYLSMDGADFRSLEDIHQALLCFADVVSQALRK